MNYIEKKEFLNHTLDLGKELEGKTNKFLEIKIGSIETIPVTIMINHPKRWFGTFEKIGWNTQVVFKDINRFIPVENPYLVLNTLIEKANKY